VPTIRSSLARFFTAIVVSRQGVHIQEGLLLKQVKLAWERSNRTELYPLLAPAAPTSPEVVGWFVANQLQTLIRQVTDDLAHNLPVVNSITLLNSLSSSPTINE